MRLLDSAGACYALPHRVEWMNTPAMLEDCYVNRKKQYEA
jgi:hypothetical protein